MAGQLTTEEQRLIEGEQEPLVRPAEFVKQFEGFSAQPYDDYKGESVGYGRLFPRGQAPRNVTEQQATQWLTEDIQTAAKAVDSMVKVPLTQAQRTALISFTYNLGTGNLASSTLLKKLNTGDYEGAADELPRWNQAGGKVLPGLVNRRARERAMFLSEPQLLAEPEPPDREVLSSVPREERHILSPEEQALIQGTNLTDEEQQLIAGTPAKESQPFTSFLMGAVQGATFEFADEIAGGIESFFTDREYKAARDEWRSKFARARRVDPGSFLAGELTGGIAMGITPLGWAGTGMRGAIAVGAAAGGAYGLGKSEAETFDGLAADMLKDAALGAGTGLVLGGIVKGVKALARTPEAETQLTIMATQFARQGKPMSPKQMKELADTLNVEGLNIAAKADDYLGTVLKAEAGSDPTKNKGFQRWLVFQADDVPYNKDMHDNFQQVWGTLNDKAKQETLQEYLQYKSQLLAVTDTLNKVGVVTDPLQLEFVRYFQDPLVKGMDIDAKLGIGVEDVFNSFTTAGHEVAEASSPFLKRYGELVKLNRKVFKTDKYKLTEYLDEGITTGLSGQQLGVAKQWRRWFDDVRLELQQRGVAVDRRPNYFPHRMADKVDVYRSLRNRFQELTKARYLPSDDEDFMRAMTMLNNGIEPTSTQQMARIIEGIKTADYTKKTLGKIAGVAMQRKGDMPKIIRQLDPEKAALNYLSTSFKSAFYRKPMQRLHSAIGTARALGADNTVRALDHYFRRMSGQPSNAHALLDVMATRWKIAAKDMVESADSAPWQRMLGKVAVQAPDLIAWSTAQIYPNLLGWNIYAPLRNLTQTLMVTAPEIGSGYGHKLAARGWRSAMKARGKGESMTKMLKSKGLISDQGFNEYARRAVEDGISNIPGVELVEKWGKVGLYMYGKSDTINRYLTWHIGQELAKDIVQGSTKAVKYLETLPVGVKNEVKQALSAGSQEQLGEVLGKWLIRKSQFNYGYAGLNQFGQDYGRLVSMFMKWGVMVGSDMVNLVSTRKGIEKLTAPLQRYMAPLAVLMVGDAALEQMRLADDPRKQLLLGSSLKNFSPANSVFSVGIPPLISAPLKTLKAGNALLEQDAGKATHILTDALYPFVPGAGALPKIKKTVQQAAGIEEEY